MCLQFLLDVFSISILFAHLTFRDLLFFLIILYSVLELLFVCCI